MPKVPVNNILLSYHIIGRGPPLVFIAGLGMDHVSWLNQIPYFQQRYTVVLPDNRGMGQSTGSDDPYTTELMAEDVAALLTKLHFEKAHIVGNSMGGMIAQEFALSHPEMVDKLFLCSTFAKHPEMITLLKKGLSQFINHNDTDDISFLPESFTFRQVFSLLLKHVFSKDFLHLHEKMITDTLQRYLSQDTFVETFLKQLHAIYHHDTVDRLYQITSETLVLTGSNDLLVPTYCSELLADHIPNATLRIVDDATHGFHIQQPDEFNQIIDSFLSEE